MIVLIDDRFRIIERLLIVIFDIENIVTETDLIVLEEGELEVFEE